MHGLKKLTAGFLILFLLASGCAQKNPYNTTDSANSSGTAAANTENSSTQDTSEDTNGTQEPILLERDLPLPDAIGKKETLVSIVTNGPQGIEIFSRDENTDIYHYILNKDKWSGKKLNFPEQIKVSAGLGRLEMLYGEDDRYYAFYALSDESYHLEATRDLEQFEDSSPQQWREKPGSREYIIPEKVGVSKNSVLCATLRYNDVCRLYDLKNDGKILDEFSIVSHNSMEVCGNFILNEGIGGKGAFIYDIEKQKKTIELESTLTGYPAYEMISPDEMYACNDNGIYTFSSGKWQLLTDSSLNTLADPNFLWCDLRHIGEQIYIVFLPNQSNEDGKYKEGLIIKYYEYSTDIPKADTTLTIWGLQENATLKSILAVFRKEHPNVHTVYEIASDTNGVMTTDDIIRQFNASIFAGNGPDLILLDDLHMGTYTERGLLYDMSKGLSKTKKSLLPGIQKLLEENPYAVPLRIALPLVIGPKDVLTDSLKSFLQQSKGMAFSTMTAEEIFDICCHFFKEGINLNRPGLTSEEVLEFLELCKTASENWPMGDPQKQDFGLKRDTNWTGLLMRKADIAFSYSNGLNQFCDYLDVIDQLSEKGISYHSAVNSFIPQGILAINQDSPNKELAIEFIQKSLNARMQESDLRDGFPVNLEALDSWKSRKSNMMMAVSDGSGPSYDTKWPSEEILQRFLENVKEADTAVFTERYTLELIKTEAVKVISGDTDARDAADRIMNQLELYYEE